jgi:hypothetical protein
MDVPLTGLSLPRTRYGGRNPVNKISYWMPVWLQTLPGLHPSVVLRTTRFVPDEPVTGMTVLDLFSVSLIRGTLMLIKQ